MKRIILIILFSILMFSSLFAEGLNKYGVAVKKYVWRYDING
jgi:hypothetical protein